MLRTDLIDSEDGENRALRSFLKQWQVPSQTIGDMRDFMREEGWDSCWPLFVTMAPDREPLTKAGAQIWIRYLIGMETVVTSAHPSATPASSTLETPAFMKILVQMLEANAQGADEEYGRVYDRLMAHIKDWSDRRVDAAKHAALQFAIETANAEYALFIKKAGENTGNNRESDYAFGSVNSAERIATALRVFQNAAEAGTAPAPDAVAGN